LTYIAWKSNMADLHNLDFPRFFSKISKENKLYQLLPSYHLFRIARKNLFTCFISTDNIVADIF
jgi:hypothetical protein